MADAPEDFVFLFTGVFNERIHPALYLPEVLVERGVWEPAASSGCLVFGRAVRGEVAGGAFEEEGENFEEDSAEGEDV